MPFDSSPKSEPAPELTDITPDVIWPGDDDETVIALRAALALIARPSNWAKGAYHTCFLFQPKWCSVGALGCALAYGNVATIQKYCRCQDFLNRAVLRRAPQLPCPPGDIIEYNDHPLTTHADIMSVWAEAIELARLDAIRASQAEAVEA